jgi:hypothetical protein
MIQGVDYLTSAFQAARTEYEWTEFLWEMVIRWRYSEQNPDFDPECEHVRIGIAEMLGTAVADKNSTVFRKIADILDALPQGNVKDIDSLTIVSGHDLSPLRFVVKARTSLEWDRFLKRGPKRTLTKREVRHLAEEMWATARLAVSGKLTRSSRLTPAERQKLIQAEIERLPTQDWTDLFKKAGCTDLVNAPAGRPPKAKKKS